MDCMGVHWHCILRHIDLHKLFTIKKFICRINHFIPRHFGFIAGHCVRVKKGLVQELEITYNLILRWVNQMHTRSIYSNTQRLEPACSYETGNNSMLSTKLWKHHARTKQRIPMAS
ncbi:hypothetical protein TorRG33x02_090340 [Trema orientale]|uniref:Uncharacterized protein n=1 Tax=Trema orientale TaxID=63057 RepID=A0A2P5FBH8_TREOI|nr:hypothetical protein TorRG33x02_090340 [Trema orientale]